MPDSIEAMNSISLVDDLLADDGPVTHIRKVTGSQGQWQAGEVVYVKPNKARCLETDELRSPQQASVKRYTILLGEGIVSCSFD